MASWAWQNLEMHLTQVALEVAVTSLETLLLVLVDLLSEARTVFFHLSLKEI